MSFLDEALQWLGLESVPAPAAQAAPQPAPAAAPPAPARTTDAVMAKNLLALSSTDRAFNGSPDPRVLAFQQSYNTFGTPASNQSAVIPIDGKYGQQTAKALNEYATTGQSVPPIPGSAEGTGPVGAVRIATGPFQSGDDAKAAALLIATPPVSTIFDVRVQDFQIAYTAAGRTPPLGTADGAYGPKTQTALNQYGVAPPIPRKLGPTESAPISGVSGGALVAGMGCTASAQYVADALTAGWAITGLPFSAEAVKVLLAQSAYETAAWKGCGNWNFGNAKKLDGDGRDWFLMKDDCGADATGRPIPCRFASYPTLTDGIKAYLNLLKRGYPSALSAALKGDIDGFVEGLVAIPRRHYFSQTNPDGTPAVGLYASGMKQYFNQFHGLTINERPTSTLTGEVELATPSGPSTGAMIGTVLVAALLIAVTELPTVFDDNEVRP